MQRPDQRMAEMKKSFGCGKKDLNTGKAHSSVRAGSVRMGGRKLGQNCEGSNAAGRALPNCNQTQTQSGRRISGRTKRVEKTSTSTAIMRTEEHTSEHQSQQRISYAVF